VAGAIRQLHAAGTLPSAYSVRELLAGSVPDGYVDLLLVDAPDPDALDGLLDGLVGAVQASIAESVAHTLRLGLSGGAPVRDVIGQATARLMSAASAGTPVVSARAGMRQVREEFERREANPGAITGVPTGMPYLDFALGGLPFGEQVVLGARTGHGKSALAGAMAMYAAGHGYPVLIMGHEMTAAMYFRRLAAAHSGVAYQAVERGNLSDEMRRRFYAAMEFVESLPIEIQDDPRLAGPDGVCSAAAWASRNKHGAVFVDYIQKERIEGYRNDRTGEIGALSSMWCAMFKRTGAAGCLLSQVNRQTVGRPRITDLADSSALEKDAYAVMLLHRAAKDDKPPEGAIVNQAELSLAKSRNGGLTRQLLHFTGYCIQFRPWRGKVDKAVFDAAALDAYESSMARSHQRIEERMPE
jgi:replicative DNA helicase